MLPRYVGAESVSGVTGDPQELLVLGHVLNLTGYCERLEEIGGGGCMWAKGQLGPCPGGAMPCPTHPIL